MQASEVSCVSLTWAAQHTPEAEICFEIDVKNKVKGKKKLNQKRENCERNNVNEQKSASYSLATCSLVKLHALAGHII